MASLSVPATLAPFEHTANHRAGTSISSHNRRKSRDPSAAPLPAFTFNPGATTQTANTTELENQDPDAETMASRGQMRRALKPPPLPDFKFNPGADLPVADRPSPSHPVLEEMVMNQQRMSRSARPAPLPQFTFAPGTSTHTSPSPTRSEFGESGLPKPASGHKRAGSEFVGGGGVEGPTLINTSPVKHESRPSGPPLSGTGRRGHAHRRSQAVSISDIDTSDLIKAHAVAKARTGSQPTTPSETATVFPMHQSPLARQSISAISPPSSPRRRGSAPGNRPRVEFAEKIDVIPRPLSMISSETEGSTSTIRYGHSLNSSINSIASPNRITSSLTSPVLEHDFALVRPRTADPSTMLSARSQSPERPMSAINLPKRPLSASGSPAMTNTEHPPIKKKHFWFSHSPDRTPTSTPKNECPDPLANLPSFTEFPPTDKSRPKTSPERSTSSSSSMKRRKYHTWTHSIFSKRTKARSAKMKPKRSPTPPMLQRRASDLANEIFDADDTVVIRSGSPDTKRTLPKIEIPAPPTTESAFKAPADVTSPVLDLDAALGPFGSDERFGGEHANKSAASRIAKLHSSERRGIIDAFGVAHRRAESAPSMPAFNRTSYSMHRHGSNTSLTEEVFDEEEEDNFLADEKKAQDESQGEEIILGAPLTTRATDNKSVGGLGLSNMSETTDIVLIVDPDQEVPSNDLASSKSTIEAPLFVETDLSKRPMSSPMSFAYPSTQSHYASSTEGRTTTSASMISSPDPDHIHFDNMPRFGPSFGEPSPDFYLRPSNDDLPSLSDSVSSSALPRISSSVNTRSSDEQRDQRSASMFVSGTSRSTQNWKRSSLATLNKLIPGSANGSKLKFETTPDCASEHKSEKKANRLSRIIGFWKSKDKQED